MFFADDKFSKYKKAEFALWTESCAGFLRSPGAVPRIPILCGIESVGSETTAGKSHRSSYLCSYHPLVSNGTIAQATQAWNSTSGCKDQITKCNDGGTNDICSSAQQFCNAEILSAVLGPHDPYYILSGVVDLYPPDITRYLTNTSLMQTIGAESTWVMSSDDIYFNFADTGDWMRTSRPLLEKVIDAGVRTVIYDGDADYILNFHGVEAMVDALQTKFTTDFAKQEFANFTVNNEVTGLYKNAGTFSYVRIFGAGHEVPAYTHGSLPVGAAAFQMFAQIMGNNSLSAGTVQTTATTGGATSTGASAADPTATQPNAAALLASGSLWTVLAAMLVAAVTPV
ncbi:Carboxypeptidase S1 [Trametes pubescens]|uniref:Carboxypeptidase S1 n=1 Tax=Trametes pubescens TaxID=154538 RepID=A0A1M2VB49_TRAPU|nr:Carboxypeptidase S1 [Trametes pubescens]